MFSNNLVKNDLAYDLINQLSAIEDNLSNPSLYKKKATDGLSTEFDDRAHRLMTDTMLPGFKMTLASIEEKLGSKDLSKAEVEVIRSLQTKCIEKVDNVARFIVNKDKYTQETIDKLAVAYDNRRATTGKLEAYLTATFNEGRDAVNREANPGAATKIKEERMEFAKYKTEVLAEVLKSIIIISPRQIETYRAKLAETAFPDTIVVTNRAKAFVLAELENDIKKWGSAEATAKIKAIVEERYQSMEDDFFTTEKPSAKEESHIGRAKAWVSQKVWSYWTPPAATASVTPTTENK